MTWTDTFGDRKRQARPWWVLAVVLLVIAATCLALAWRGDNNSPLMATVAPQFEPTHAPPSVADDSAPKPAEVGSPVVARSAPVELRIPAMDLAVSLSALGLNPNGTAQVPTNAGEPGWFRKGVSPGQVGSAVILGHVDSTEGPAVFYRLRFLQRGDRVTVRLADGVIAHFAVSAVATYPNEHFPARKVYGSHGFSGLQLVTCGGEYDAERDGYQSNVVVYTTLVATSRTGAAKGHGRHNQAS